jgi:hypothetical protein
MVDADGRIVLVNAEIERLFGYSREELLGRSVDHLVPERFRDAHGGYRRGFLAEPKVRAMGAGRDLFGLRKDGTEVPVEIGLTPVVTDEGVFVLGAIVDITARKHAEEERRRLEEQLRQAQKLEAVGTLAGGIAHDFNNVLAAIVGYAELLEDSVTDPRARRDLSQIQVAAQRGRGIVERILRFSRRQEGALQPLALDRTVEEAVGLLRATLPPSVDIRVHADPGTPRVLADATSVQQVVMNLGTNAAHAMAAGGALDIRLEPTYVRDSVARAHPGLKEGPYALVAVRDTGTGIDPAILERVFEPFFTTKEAGAGTGLGLAVVHGIMRDHHGAIELESQAGAGTTARCYFPALAYEGELEAVTESPVARGAGQHILLVDDEPTLATVGQRRLEALGYRVTVRTDSREAAAAFEADPEAFDAVITDYFMPRMTGLELALEIARVRPGTPIVLLTGYMEELPQDTLERAGVRRVVQKPVTLDELAAALHELVGRAS